MDVVSAEIVNQGALETYRNVKIDGSPTDKDLKGLVGPGPPENLRPRCWNFLTLYESGVPVRRSGYHFGFQRPAL